MTERRHLRLRGNGDAPPTLEQRITLALSPDHDIASPAIAALFGEVESAITEVEESAEAAKARALDPTIGDAEAARQQRDDCVFRLERLKAALPPLQQRYSQVRLAERRAGWRSAYAQVKTKRDATAEQLKAIYTEFTTKLIDALIEAKAVDQAVAKINSTAPNGEHDRLLTVECAARQVTGVADNFSLMNVKLPSFHQPNTWSWPPPTPAIDVAQVVPAAMRTHPMDNWHQELKQRDADRQREAKRTANFYARQERTREDLANAEARAAQDRRSGATT